MSDSKQPDKSGLDLTQQRFRMLEEIARDLAGDVVFPTCFDISARIRSHLENPDISMDQVVTVLGADPLISSKVLRMANSAAFNPAGDEVRSLKGAVTRLGMKTVCTTATAIVMRQMLSAKGMANFAEISERLWLHSVKSASAAWVIARRLTRINPDEALLAGLVHDLGAFYMLHRSIQYEELRERPETVKYLVVNWHESIGVTLLGALGLPEDIVQSAADHDQLRPAPRPPRNLADVVYLANFMAGSHFEWVYQDIEQALIDHYPLGEECTSLAGEIETHALEMQAALARRF